MWRIRTERSSRTLRSQPLKRWRDWRRWLCSRCIHGVRAMMTWSILTASLSISIRTRRSRGRDWLRAPLRFESSSRTLGLESFLKSTGGKGLHVVVPIVPEYGWPVIKQFAHAVVLQMEKQQPRLYLTKMTKAERKGRIYLDYLRNERGATAVAAFSPRARVGAPVSLPLNWSDLKLPERPVAHVADFEEWKGRLNRDPWKQLFKSPQKITAKMLGQFKIAPSK